MQMFLLWNLSSEGKQWGVAVFAGLLMGWVEYKALRDFWSFIKFSVPFGKWASQIQEENLEFYQASLGTPSKLLERMVYNCN